MAKEHKRFPWGLAGIFGMIAGGVIAISGPSDAYKLKVFQRENKPSVIKLYRFGRDAIYVENSERKGEYITLDSYLAGIKDAADKKIEQENIRKAVDGYQKNSRPTNNLNSE